MKFYKKLILLFVIQISLVLKIYPQVGINSETPLGIFHIDSQKNTTGTITSASNETDDIIVNSLGNLGVGTLNPQAKLHIKTTGTSDNPISGFSLIDGNQKADKYLVSDANGIATWNTLVPLDAIFYTKGTKMPDLKIINNSVYYNTTSYIELPPGRYVLMVSMLPNLWGGTDATGYYSFNSTFADENTVQYSGSTLDKIISPDVEGQQVIPAGITMGSNTTGMMIGSLVIENSTSSNKKYYYMAGDVSTTSTVTTCYLRLFGGTWGEDGIVAFRVPTTI